MSRATIKVAVFSPIFIFHRSAHAGWSRISPSIIELRGDID